MELTKKKKISFLLHLVLGAGPRGLSEHSFTIVSASLYNLTKSVQNALENIFTMWQFQIFSFIWPYYNDDQSKAMFASLSLLFNNFNFSRLMRIGVLHILFSALYIMQDSLLLNGALFSCRANKIHFKGNNFPQSAARVIETVLNNHWCSWIHGIQNRI